MPKKVVVIYPDGPKAVWSLGKGISSTLTRLGYEVSDQGVSNSRICSLSPEDMRAQDYILVSGPEYIWRSLRCTYSDWDKLSAKKIGWLHETVDREDYPNNPIASGPNHTLPLDKLRSLTDVLYTPAAQDEKHGMYYLPFAVDTEVFTPKEKTIKVFFAGSLYDKRREFLKRFPEVSVRNQQDYLTYKGQCTFDEYKDLTAASKVVLNMPTLSRLNSTRVYEAMACKAAVVTPLMGEDDRNYSMFSNGRQIMYYTNSPLVCLRALDDERVATSIAEEGYQEILRNHTLEHRLKKIFSQETHDSEKSFDHRDNGARRVVPVRPLTGKRV